MITIRYLAPRYLMSVIRGVAYKLIYGDKIQLNPLKVYIGAGVRIRIRNGGRIVFNDSGNRIFIDNQCDLGASSGGLLEIYGGVFLNRGCIVEARQKVTLGTDTMFGPYVCVMDHHHGVVVNDISFRFQGMSAKPVSIGSNVWLAGGVVVTAGAIIGESVVVGANSVVRGSLENQSLYVGAPARFVRRLSDDTGN